MCRGRRGGDGPGSRFCSASEKLLAQVGRQNAQAHTLTRTYTLTHHMRTHHTHVSHMHTHMYAHTHITHVHHTLTFLHTRCCLGPRGSGRCVAEQVGKVMGGLGRGCPTGDPKGHDPAELPGHTPAQKRVTEPPRLLQEKRLASGVGYSPDSAARCLGTNPTPASYQLCDLASSLSSLGLCLLNYKRG